MLLDVGLGNQDARPKLFTAAVGGSFRNLGLVFKTARACGITRGCGGIFPITVDKGMPVLRIPTSNSSIILPDLHLPMQE